MSRADSNRGKREGRDRAGRFAVGNPGGPGNPHVRVMAELRAEINAEATPERVRLIMRKLFDLALEGNVPAAKEFLDRSIGKPIPSSEAARQAEDAMAGMLYEVVGELVARSDDQKGAAKFARELGALLQARAEREGPRVVEAEEG